MRAVILITSVAFCRLAQAGSDGDFLAALGDEVESSSLDSSSESEGAPVLNIFEAILDYDGLFSSDVKIHRYNSNFEWQRGKTTLGLGYTYANYDIDFSNPTDLLREPVNLTEENHRLSFTLSQELSDSWSTNLSLGAYTGFTDFRSIWISQFFLQEQGDLEGYREPDPFGFSVALGNTFTLPNKIDSIRLDVGYSRDRIAPGFERVIDFSRLAEGLSPEFSEASDDTLDTVSIGLTGNFYITNKINTQWTTRALFISDREVRTQHRLTTAWSPFERVNIRGEFGATIEAPDFEAYYGGVSINVKVLNSLTWSLGYRIYNDSGEVTTSNFNTSAPAVDSRELSTSLFWDKGPHAVRLSVAWLQTDFEDVASLENIPFATLFRDRDFIAVRAAYSYEF